MSRRRSRAARPLVSMSDVERLLKVGAVEIQVEPADSDDARWCLEQYFSELAKRFEAGFDPSRGNEAGQERPQPDGAFVVARLHGRPVGCGMLRQIGDGVGEVKRMWVGPDVRGMGVASRILARLEQAARENGWNLVRLDTNRTLAEAQAMYRKAG